MPTNNTPTPAAVTEVTVTRSRYEYWEIEHGEIVVTVRLTVKSDGFRIEHIREAGKTPRLVEFGTRAELARFCEQLDRRWGIDGLLSMLLK
jgi:hypothetical protein